jgi:hypothetical protein
MESEYCCTAGTGTTVFNTGAGIYQTSVSPVLLAPGPLLVAPGAYNKKERVPVQGMWNVCTVT